MYATGSQIDRIYPMLVGVTDEQHMPEVKEGYIERHWRIAKGISVPAWWVLRS